MKQSYEFSYDEMVPEKISSRERLSRTTGRTIEFYNQFLNTTPEDYKDKNVLNIGAGTSSIARELERLNIQSGLLVNLDLAYKDVGETKGVFRYLMGKPSKRREIPGVPVAADMKRLPFKDESFDMTFFLWSLGWLRKRDRPIAVLESLRVEKFGGEMKIYPVSLPKNAETIIQKYPFIRMSIPKQQSNELLRSGVEEKDVVAAARQYLANVEMTAIEQMGKFLEFLRGKRIGTIEIVKDHGVSPEAVAAALRDLENKKFVFG